MKRSSAERVAAKAVQNIIHHGPENFFLLTLTFAEVVPNDKAAKIFHSFNTNRLLPLHRSLFLKVLEFQKRGAPHYHLLYFTEGARNGSIYGRGFWLRWGEQFKAAVEMCRIAREKYGFGRCQVEPLRPSTRPEVAVRYLMKYLWKSAKHPLLGNSRFFAFGRAMKYVPHAPYASPIDRWKIEAKQAFLNEIGLEEQDLEPYAEACYPWLRGRMALRELWREHIHPLARARKGMGPGAHETLQ